VCSRPNAELLADDATTPPVGDRRRRHGDPGRAPGGTKLPGCRNPEFGFRDRSDDAFRGPFVARTHPERRGCDPCTRGATEPVRFRRAGVRPARAPRTLPGRTLCLSNPLGGSLIERSFIRLSCARCRWSAPARAIFVPSLARAAVEVKGPSVVHGGDPEGGIERDDPFAGAYGAALGVYAGDFVFTTVAGVQELREGEPIFPSSFEAQLQLVGEHLKTRLAHFGCPLSGVVDATVWIHPSIDMPAGLLLDLLHEKVFEGVVPTISFLRSPMLYPEALVGVKVVAFHPRAQ
jgi:enamine deaminase RidA (YjgF/YER057c/UK114 family)